MEATMKWLVNRSALLLKMTGKGGWTYCELPEIEPDPHSHFGWVLLNGFIDNEKVVNFRAMPAGNGSLFFSVNAQLRKALGKSAGDTVHLKLYKGAEKPEIPSYLSDCFGNEPAEILFRFEAIPEAEQSKWIRDIESAADDEKRAERIVKLFTYLSAAD